MVEKQRDSDRVGEEEEQPVSSEADPTLDIVRQMIVEAEAIPAPAKLPRGASTPRPGAAAPAPEPQAAPAPVTVPFGTVPVGTVPVGQMSSPPARLPDALSEGWDDDWDDGGADEGAADDDWDDLSSGALTRSYGIVDMETGEVRSGTRNYVGAFQEEAPVRRPGVIGRLIGGTLRLAAPLLARLLGLVWRGIRALSGAIWRRVVEFMRRPDAARRLALAIIVFSVLVWPVEVLWLTLLIPLALLICWASVGNEGCVELVIQWHARLKARDPAKAERIRARAAAVTRGLNRGLERLPQSWTQGLYLPDFETDGYVPEKLKVDPFEELAARVHSAKRTGG